MIDKELLRKIRNIHIKTKHLVNDAIAGKYLAAFKGMGMEFEEVREYSAGDDVRTIDWNVTARTGTPYIKKFREERELTILLMVDLSASNRFGTKRCLKKDLAAELAAILAFSAIRNNDNVGLLLFSETIEKFIPPRKGIGHVFSVISSILNTKPNQRGTNIEESLEYVSNVLKRKSVIFLISDFLNDNSFDKGLSILGKKHDLIGIRIYDEFEDDIPDLGTIDLLDLESGREINIDTSNSMFRKKFKETREKEKKLLKNLFSKYKVDLLEVKTNEKDIMAPIMRFFKSRRKRT